MSFRFVAMPVALLCSGCSLAESPPSSTVGSSAIRAADPVQQSDGLAAEPLPDPTPSADSLVDAVAGALPDGARDDLRVECAHPEDCVIVTVQPDNERVAAVLEVLDQTCAAHGDCSVWLTSISSTDEGKRAELTIAASAR